MSKFPLIIQATDKRELTLADPETKTLVATVHHQISAHDASVIWARLFQQVPVLCRALEDLTPGGSEFHQDPLRCIQFIKERLDFRNRTHIELAEANKRIGALEAVLAAAIAGMGGAA